MILPVYRAMPLTLAQVVVLVVAKMGSHCWRGQIERHLIAAIAASLDVAEGLLGRRLYYRWLDRRFHRRLRRSNRGLRWARRPRGWGRWPWRGLGRSNRRRR